MHVLSPNREDSENLILSISYIISNRHRIGFYIKDEQMSALSKRRASFGFGKKSDFTKDQTSSPRATLYSHKSVFEPDVSTKRGKSFGLSR